jgi:hypothetical protein
VVQPRLRFHIPLIEPDVQISRRLFDRLVGGEQETGRHLKAERSGGLQMPLLIQLREILI